MTQNKKGVCEECLRKVKVRACKGCGEKLCGSCLGDAPKTKTKKKKTK